MASFGCTKNNVNGHVAGTANIYASGFEDSQGYVILKYWLNGKSVDLPNSDPTISDLNTTGIVVSGGDVYVSGVDYNRSANAEVAACWKNGLLVDLTNGPDLSYTTGIAISGNDIYVSGYTYQNQRMVAMYWKNGNPVILTDTTMEGFASSIAVSGSDVYVGGHQAPENNYNRTTGVIWKNGIPHFLTDTSGISGVSALTISGNDVYAAGYIYSGALNGQAYWKNDSVFIIGDPSSSANSIAVSGNDVYVAGNDNGSYGPYSARLWKNGNELKLDDGGYFSYASSVFVSGNDVYVGGVNSKIGRVATYWKNGKPVHFKDGDTITSLWVSE
jgi:hypothetical protein